MVERYITIGTVV